MSKDNIADIRRSALDFFNNSGYPEKTDEEYKYMKLEVLRDTSFRTACTEAAKRTTLEDIRDLLIEECNGNHLTLVNGNYCEPLCNHNLPDGVIAGSLLEHMSHPKVSTFLAKLRDPESNAFSAQNTAEFRDALFVFLPENCVVESPLQILKICDSSGGSYLSQDRVFIYASKGSRIHIVESVVSKGAEFGFSNSVVEVFCEEKSNVQLTKLQNDLSNCALIDNTSLLLEKESSAKVTTVSMSAEIIRNNLEMQLNGEHSNAELYGFYFGKNHEQVDNHTEVKHNVPNCESTELYKGLADGNVTATFNGKIFVKKDAQKTNAFQSNKSILLSDDAVVNTKPQLEIFADDVKCSHGATIGQMDEEAMFYLRSRGIGEDAAQALLVNAFAADVLNEIGLEKLQSEIQEDIQQNIKT